MSALSALQILEVIAKTIGQHVASLAESDITRVGASLGIGQTMIDKVLIPALKQRTPDKPPSKRNINHTPSDQPEKKQKQISPDTVDAFPDLPPEEDMHRRIAPIQVSAGQNARKGARANMVNDGEEVEVVPPPAKISKIMNDYTTIKLPWHEIYYGQISNVNSQDVLVLRLNSITDPWVNGTNHRPQGYIQWSTLYKYYRVLESQVNVTVHYEYGHWTNISAATGAGSVRTTSLAIGYEPTDDVTDVYPNFQSMVEGKHSKVEWLNPKDFELKGSGTLAAIPAATAGGERTLSYHYNPFDWDYHVHELGVEERWTQIANSPDVLHFLAIHVMTPGGQATAGPPATQDVFAPGDFVNYRIDMNISYTVQLRENTHTKQHDTASA